MSFAKPFHKRKQDVEIVLEIVETPTRCMCKRDAEGEVLRMLDKRE
jgi:hypothetical protein